MKMLKKCLNSFVDAMLNELLLKYERGMKMKILIIEDTALKFASISRVLKNAGFTEIDSEKNLEDGLNAIEKSVKSDDKYGVIITDMWYPREDRGPEEQCGLELVDTVKARGYNIPVIICSNQQYRCENALGEVLYKENGDWDKELLISLVKKAYN